MNYANRVMVYQGKTLEQMEMLFSSNRQLIEGEESVIEEQPRTRGEINAKSSSGK